MLSQNHILIRQRIKEIFIDYICIVIYLIILFGANMIISFGFLGGIPKLSEWQSQLIAILTSVIPVILFFSILDFRKGSIGKIKSGLKLYFKNKTFIFSLLRNIVKFLPWQLAHIGVIHGMYSDFDAIAVIFATTSMIIAFTMLIMGFIRNDKRHFADFIAGTQVQSK